MNKNLSIIDEDWGPKACLQSLPRWRKQWTPQTALRPVVDEGTIGRSFILPI
jgi:hypothetical protein